MNGVDTGLDEIEILKNLTLAIIPTITLVMVFALKHASKRIPARFLPIVAPLIGALISAVGQVFGIPGLDELGVIGGTIAGSAATGIHQAFHQNTGEKLVEAKVEEKNVARSSARAEAKKDHS
jgi:hypothetical protein